MAQISRLKSSEIQDGLVVLAENDNAEFNQLVNESNSQDTRLTDLESNSVTIAGVKTFSSIPILPGSDPTTSNQAARKAYVDATKAPVGALVSYIGTTAPSGWLLCDSKTIGNASSGGTARANDDTQTLFELLWNSFADAQATVSGGRGSTASADFAANKTITLPDLRGRIPLGKDDMGGSAANRITSASTNGANATTLGGVGGAQTHTLTTAEMPAHTHAIGTAITVNGGAGGIAEASPGAVNSGSTGGGGAHSNTQPWIALNYIIRY